MPVGFEFFSTIVVNLTIIALAGVVFFNDRKSLTNILFFLLCAVLAGWSILNYISIHNVVPTLMWVRLVMVFAAIQGPLFFLFIYTFPSKKNRLSNTKLSFFYLFTGLNILLAPFTFNSFIVNSGLLIPRPNLFILVPFGCISILFVLLGVVTLIRKFIKAREIERKGLRHIIVGFVCMFVLMIAFNFIIVNFFGDLSFIQYSSLFVLPFILFTTYAIIRHGLLDVKLIATELLVIILVGVLLIEGLNADSIIQIIYKIFFAGLASLLGVLLVKSVYKEIKQRKELSKLAKNLEDANTKLKELDDLKTEFLSIATHQLRTPLSIIKGYIELIEDGAYGGKPHKKLFKVLNDMDISNERLIKLVDEFLDVTRIEQGRTQYHFEKMDFGAMVADVLKELGEKASQKKIVFDDAFSGKFEMIGDSDRLRHGVFNFVDNAIKYSPAGSTVNIVVAKEKGGVAVRVKDQGPGLDEKDIGNLFQKFYRSPNVSRDFEGTGLGIYVCRMFIEAHGGHVWAKSEGIGKGSEFGFWVPEKQVKT